MLRRFLLFCKRKSERLFYFLPTDKELIMISAAR